MSRTMRTMLAALLLVWPLACVPPSRGRAPDARLPAGAGGAQLPAVSGLPATSFFPDPLITRDGRRVRTAAEWRNQRRPELQRLFEHYVYGYAPAASPITATVRRTDPDALGGAATLQEIQLSFPPEGTDPIDLLLVIPNRRSGPVPVILGLNSHGNHVLLPDPLIALPTHWMRPNGPGVVKNRATDAGRGAHPRSFDIAYIVSRGYAAATFFNGDLDPDHDDPADGIHRHFYVPGQSAPRPHDWGTLAAWAWGFQRAVDHLITVPEIDRSRIGVYGHSRNGKAALLAAAFDERIALTIPHQAGTGGTAPSRPTGESLAETVEAINRDFPHWFNDTFPLFNGQEARLPLDQHSLIALVAPRRVLVTGGSEDRHANPRGAFEMARLAGPVYALLGEEGFGGVAFPAGGGTVGNDRLAFYYRSGSHSVTPADWERFLDFADRHPG